jgi:histidinol-phosphatase (PHP family)
MKDIKKSKMVLEINSSGFRKPISEQYPSKELLELAYELDINITFGSDAHKVEQIGFGYDKTVKPAHEVGYIKCVTFKNRDKKIVVF